MNCIGCFVFASYYGDNIYMWICFPIIFEMLKDCIFIKKEGKRCVLIAGTKQLEHHGQHCVCVCECVSERETYAERMDN